MRRIIRPAVWRLRWWRHSCNRWHYDGIETRCTTCGAIFSYGLPWRASAPAAPTQDPDR